MIKGKYDPMCIPYVEFRELSEDLIRTRGNRYKLIQHPHMEQFIWSCCLCRNT